MRPADVDAATGEARAASIAQTRRLGVGLRMLQWSRTLNLFLRLLGDVAPFSVLEFPENVKYF
tara:strand:- start:2016 stop:2204 length:189 start_codon:yes stop_codon:yes gene_type:complete